MEERGKAITHNLDCFVCLFIIITLIKKNFFFKLAELPSRWDLSSPTRDQICAPCSARAGPNNLTA